MAQAERSAAAASAAYDGRYFDCELHRDHWFRNNAAKRARRWREILRMLEPRASDRILEIGCGAGAHAIPLARFVQQVVGVDFSPAGVRRAAGRTRVEQSANATFVVADAAALPFGAETFDKVAAIDFVEHVDDALLARVLTEAHRVLASDGIVAIYTPCLTHYVERLKERNLILRQIPGHIAVRTPEACVRLLAGAGFAVRSCRFLPSDYPVFGAVDRALCAMPRIGPWFRFRICIVAHKAAA
jgi:cyclopropane fatty-acyl-phospholipid synthase-like methyltransferase